MGPSISLRGLWPQSELVAVDGQPQLGAIWSSAKANTRKHSRRGERMSYTPDTPVTLISLVFAQISKSFPVTTGGNHNALSDGWFYAGGSRRFQTRKKHFFLLFFKYKYNPYSPIGEFAIYRYENNTWSAKAKNPQTESVQLASKMIIIIKSPEAFASQMCSENEKKLCTCRWMKTTEPRRRQVPPCRSTWSIRRICRKRIPLENHRCLNA